MRRCQRNILFRLEYVNTQSPFYDQVLGAADRRE